MLYRSCTQDRLRAPGLEKETLEQQLKGPAGFGFGVCRGGRQTLRSTDSPSSSLAAGEGFSPAILKSPKSPKSWWVSDPESSLPDQLCIVVGFPRQEFELPPVQKLMQAGERVLGNGALIHVIPHLHSHQGHSDIQWPVELRRKVGNTCPKNHFRLEYSG